MWRAKTNKGRVVYDRPKNRFTCNDALRIVRGLSGADPDPDLVCFANVVQVVFRILKSDPVALTELIDWMIIELGSPDKFGTGGGRFGGGGATRDF